MKRAIALFFLLLCAAPLWAAPALSLREIGGVDLGFVDDGGVTISPNGRYLAVLSTPGEKGSDCTIIERRTHKFWDVPGAFRMEPLTFARTGHALWIWGLRADEPLLGAPHVRKDKAFIALYDPAKRRYRFVLQGDVENWDVPSASILSADGRTLIYASQDGWVRGFSTRTGRQKWKKRAIDKGDVPVNVVLSPEGKRALRFPDDDGKFQTTQIISTRTGRVLQTLKMPLRGGAMTAFQSGRFAPRGNMVAVFKPDDQSWHFFDGRSGRCQWKMGHDLSANRSDLEWVWSPDARRVAVSGPNGFELRDANNGRVLSSSAHLRPQENARPWLGSLVFSPDGKFIYSLGGSDTGFGAETVLWQLRIDSTRAQRRADKYWLDKMRASQERFALSPRHINQSLIQAARGGDAKRVAFLLDRGADIEAHDFHLSCTPLVDAVNAEDVYAGPYRYAETVKLLLARGANIKPYGSELLASAAGAGNDNLVHLFLARGVKINADASGYGTSSALDAAIEFGRLSTVRLLLDAGAKVNGRGEGGMTPLLDILDTDFAEGKQAAIVQLLLEHGADPNAADATGQTPLMRLLQWDAVARIVSPAQQLSEQLQIIRLLLLHGANPDAHDKAGNSARSLAVSPALKKLLDTPQ